LSDWSDGEEALMREEKDSLQRLSEEAQVADALSVIDKRNAAFARTFMRAESKSLTL
jgi:hypothetical protein